jgi:peptidoglycan/xylan/chitin deacetylase (PgdA/CDA1 family)
VEIGAHTETHCSLAALPAADQRHEVAASKARLEQLLGLPVTSFAYPYGGHDDYTVETARIVKEAGFACACANHPGLVAPGADLFRLRRHMVPDWTGEEFAGRLRGYFEQ